MTYRLVRSRISELVAEVVGSRQGRQLLEAHQWEQGMPIVIAQPGESLCEAMALADFHEPPLFLATQEPDTEDLCFMYLGNGSGVLEEVAPQDPATTVWELYSTALQRGCFHTFRLEHRPHSSVVHAVPPLRASDARLRKFQIPVVGSA